MTDLREARRRKWCPGWVGGALMLMASLVGSPASATGQTAEAEAVLLEMNRLLFDTQMLDHDPTYLLENSVEGYLAIAPGGVVETREQVIRGLRAFAEVDSLSVTEARVVVTGPTAVVISRLEVFGVVGIPVEPGPRRVLTVFSLGVDNRWRAVSRGVMPCHPRAVQAGLC